MKCSKCGLPKRCGGVAPDRKAYFDLVKQSYEPSASKKVGDWELVSETPTLKFYKSGNDVVVSIRGTFDSRDTKADATIPVNSLHLSDRFKEDERFLNEFKQKNPDLKYYGVGHSLGGAILDLFLHKGLISEGQSYNPAIQPHDFGATLPNHRIFMSGDPLYTLVRLFLKQKPEVIDENSSIFRKLARLTPIGNIVTAGEYLKSHALDQFEGKGGRLRSVGNEPITGPHPGNDGICAAVASNVLKKKYNTLQSFLPTAQLDSVKNDMNQQLAPLGFIINKSSSSLEAIRELLRAGGDGFIIMISPTAVGHMVAFRTDDDGITRLYNPNPKIKQLDVYEIVRDSKPQEFNNSLNEFFPGYTISEINFIKPIGIPPAGKGKSALTLHAIVVKKPFDLHEARAIARRIMKTKKDKFMRETSTSYRFRNIPKTKFSSFVSKQINPHTTLIFGNLK